LETTTLASLSHSSLSIFIPAVGGAKNFLLAALRLAGYLLPWFSPGNNRSLSPFSSPLSNKSAPYVIKQSEQLLSPHAIQGHRETLL